VSATDGSELSSDWGEALEIATDCNLAPLFYKRLKQNGIRRQVPADVWRRLREAYLVNAARSARLYRQLEALLRCLRESDIPVMVLKGAFLGEAVYGDTAARPMNDFDLLVRKADLQRTRAALLELGCSCERPADVESVSRRYHRLPWFLMGDTVVEVHWTIMPHIGAVRVDAAGLWRRAQPARVTGVDVLALSNEDLLLHLSLHSFHKHLCFVLRSLCDVAYTAERFRGEIDWTQVAERARQWGAARHVGLPLSLARSMLRAEVPDDALKRLVPGGLDARILATARESVFAYTDYEQQMPLFDSMGARTLSEKTDLARERIFLPRDEMARLYPRARTSRYLYRYYVLRVRDVTRTYASHALKRAHLLRQARGQDPNAVLLRWLSGKP